MKHTNNKHTDAIDPAEDEESKTRRKQRMTELQKMGEELLTLNKRQLDLIAIPDNLLMALKEYQRLPNKNEAKRRQLQFIGKLMRAADHDSIRSALDKLKAPDRHEMRRSQEIEHWGELLLAGEADTVEAFLNDRPLAERQTLKQLIRRHADAVNNDQGNGLASPSDAVRLARRRLLDYIKTVMP